MDNYPRPPSCNCNFRPEERREQLADFLRKYGDEVPEAEIQKAVSDENIKHWVATCECVPPFNIIGVGHYEQTDWFLCAIKGLAVREDLRERGFGRELVEKLVKKAEWNPRCSVLGADVTYDNIRSIRALKSRGFQEVGEFCWEEGEKPAEILHLIHYKPTVNHQCLRRPPNLP